MVMRARVGLVAWSRIHRELKVRNTRRHLETGGRYPRRVHREPAVKPNPADKHGRASAGLGPPRARRLPDTLGITESPHLMIEAQWLLFLLASVVVIATPGQDMLLVMSRWISRHARWFGYRRGSDLGLLWPHGLRQRLGLGALLRTSDWLFTGIKFVGAAYLLYLGVQLLLTRSAQISAAASAPQPLMRQFITGAASNITNPKIAVFYFAFSVRRTRRWACHTNDLSSRHRLRCAHFPYQRSRSALRWRPLGVVPLKTCRHWSGSIAAVV